MAVIGTPLLFVSTSQIIVGTPAAAGYSLFCFSLKNALLIMLFLKSSGVKRPDTFASLSLEAKISVFYHNAWSNDHVELIKAFLPTRVEEFRFVDDGHAFGLSLQWSHVARRSSCTSPRSSFLILQSIALENAAADNNAHIEFVFSEI